MTDRNRIIEKIRKLVALSDSPNENEAMAAMEKAQALLAQHDLQMSEVMRDSSVADERAVIRVYVDKESRPWQRRVAWGVAELYFCKYYFKVEQELRGRSIRTVDVHHFVGVQHNAEIAESMYVYIAKTIDRLARSESVKIYGRQIGSYVNSFRNAAAERIRERIRERIAESRRGGIKTSTGTNLPALASLYDTAAVRNERALREAGIHLVTRRSKSRIDNELGSAHGRAAGDRINLGDQISASSVKRIQ